MDPTLFRTQRGEFQYHVVCNATIIVYFECQKPEIALVDSAMMTATSIYMTVKSRLPPTPFLCTLNSPQKLLHGPTKGKATWLLVPYCAWISYVTYLNAGVVYLNRGRYIPKND